MRRPLRGVSGPPPAPLRQVREQVGAELLASRGGRPLCRVGASRWDSKPRKQGVFGLSEDNFLNSLNVSEADNVQEQPKAQFNLRIATWHHAFVGW